MVNLSNESVAWAANLAALVLSAANLIALARVVVTKEDLEKFKGECSREFELFKAQFWREFADHKADQCKEELKNEKEHREMRHDLRGEFQAGDNQLRLDVTRLQDDVKDLLRGSGGRGNSAHPPSSS